MLLADLLSLVRLPLAVLFVWAAARPAYALAVLAAAGVSDVLDGWAARRAQGTAIDLPHRGDWLDPLCDKIFVATVLAAVYVVYRPPAFLLVLTASRELIQLLAMVVYRVVPRLRRLRYNFRANALGKVTTVSQFVTIAAFLLQVPVAALLALASGTLGILSVAIYLNRARTLARDAA